MRAKTFAQRRFFARPFRLRALLCVLAVSLFLVGGDQWLSGRVVSVPDGDTLEIYTGAGGRKRIRPYGVDCPELDQPGGARAAASAKALALFQKAGLTVMDHDRYDRGVAIVTLREGKVLNEELLRQGHASVYGYYCRTPRCTAWKKLEAEAKQAGLGLWAGPGPVPPWKWRQRNRPGRAR